MSLRSTRFETWFADDLNKYDPDITAAGVADCWDGYEYDYKNSKSEQAYMFVNIKNFWACWKASQDFGKSY